MPVFLWLFIGLALGGVIGWLAAAARVRGALASRIDEAESRAGIAENNAAALEGKLTELRAQTLSAAADFDRLRLRMEGEQAARVKAETSLEETVKRLEEEKKLLDEAKTKLTDTFKALASDTLKSTLSSSSEEFLKLAGESFGKLLSEARGDLGQRQEAIQGLVAPLSEKLKSFDEHVREIEKNRVDAYSSLSEQIKGLSQAQMALQKETGNLSQSLKAPKVVGSWGESTLERVVELSGLSEYCDFKREVSVNTEEGRLRPDLVVYLPGDRQIVVDAKATFEAYQEAVSAETEEERRAALERHSSQVRAHMQRLAGKAYWKQFEKAPEFVVMFIPRESFYSATQAIDPTLYEDAMANRVLLATPTNLLALLRAVAFGWRQEQIARNAQEISTQGRQLYERMSTLADYILDIGKGLERATQSYNKAVGSIETRVLPAARRFKDLGATTAEEIAPLTPVETAQRQLSLPETPENRS